MINLILFGPPGSGKGTQAQLIVQQFNLIHVSTGDLFRYNLGNHTALGQKAKLYMDKGELVPDELTISMLKEKVLEYPDSQGFIFDGFPRTINQAEQLDRLMEEQDAKIDLLIKLEVEEDEIVRRLLLRGKDSGRVDDQSEDTIRKRIEVYKEETTPVFEYYNDKNIAYEIEGTGSIEEIFARIESVIHHVKDNQSA